MKKNYYLLMVAFLTSFFGFSQAVLPTSYSFTTTTLPTGWSTVGTGSYTGSGNTPPTLKFDSSGDLLTINFASAPGNLTYYIGGNSFAGGTFLVEESVDGNTWTTLHSHTALTSTYTLTTDVPNANSRYIRFNYVTKVTGNIGLDDVNIAVGAATPTQEINVKNGSTTIVNNGIFNTSSGVGSMSPINFTIENLGTGSALTLSTVTISGANASDYTLVSQPSSINASSSSALEINFTPGASGSRPAIITIPSNDADENPYVINIAGIGGGLATEPSVQPTNLVFSNVKSYRFNGSFSAANGVDGYVVLRKKGAPITDLPVDGTVYMRGDAIGSSQVVSSGTGTTFSPNNIVANTGYYFAVFSYNGTGIYRNYLQTAPLTANVSSLATMMTPGMYNGLSTSSSTFMTDLSALVNPHTSRFYSTYGSLMVSLFESRDTSNNQRVVTCVYSGQNKVYTEPFDWTTQGFSREHSYCHNWMPSNPADSPERPEYSDFHLLFPTNQNDVNSVRSNYPLGEVVTQTSSYLGSKFGLDANGHQVFEPRDEHKGDVARAIMYAAICYNGIDGLNWKLRNPISSSIAYGQDQAVLKQWHFQDPPSNWEISRNDFIDSIQHNRNPFIDSINYVCYVDFSQMTYRSLGCSSSASLDEELITNFAIYPVPSREVVYVQVNGTMINEYTIYDMQGRIITSSSNFESKVLTIPTNSYTSGSYMITVTTPYGRVTKKMIIE
jgi:endonuclease I